MGIGQEKHSDASPAFLISPTRRSGTNFLAEALIASGLCQWPRAEVLAREDFLLAESYLLRMYAERTAARWRILENSNQVVQVNEALLLKSIGSGILRFIGLPTSSDRRLLLKTPNCRHLANFPELFPSCFLILLVRDGRDCSESQVRSGFQMDYAAAFRNWATRTREMLEFIRAQDAHFKMAYLKLIHYEDLVRSPQACLESLRRFLGLDATSIDAAAVKRLPVFGSSELSAAAPLSFRWSVEAKPTTFNPIGRWQAWDTNRCTLFKSIAGQELIELGYAVDDCW